MSKMLICPKCGNREHFVYNVINHKWYCMVCGSEAKLVDKYDLHFKLDKWWADK